MACNDLAGIEEPLLRDTGLDASSSPSYEFDGALDSAIEARTFIAADRAQSDGAQQHKTILFVDVSHAESQTGSLSIPKPHVSEGDFLLLSLYMSQSWAVVAEFDAWTPVGEANDQGFGSRWYYRFASIDEPSVYVMRFDQPIITSAAIVAYSGVDPANPLFRQLTVAPQDTGCTQPPQPPHEASPFKMVISVVHADAPADGERDESAQVRVDEPSLTVVDFEQATMAVSEPLIRCTEVGPGAGMAFALSPGLL